VLRIDSLTPAYQREIMHAAWEQLIARGCVAGLEDVGFDDGSVTRVTYCALANVLPGQHLVVIMPATWPEDELGTTDDGAAAASDSRLSPRERDVLTLIAAGAGMDEIAAELVISPATVRTHLQRALRKLNARNRPHAIAVDIQRGLIEPLALETEDRTRSAT
jgi:DNA-binding CsgD family transcriptional regulator